MLRKHPILIFILMMILISLACNAFASGGDEPPALELPPPNVTLEATAVTDDTLAPTATLPGDAPIDVTAAPGDATVNILVDLNIRSGPGVIYERIGFFTKGATVPLVGRDPVSGWWRVQCPPNIDAPQCWVSGGPEYTAPNNAGGVPVAAVPPTPTPQPTNTPVPESETITSVEGGIVAYADDDGLWVLPLDMAQNPPGAGTPVQIVADPSIEQLVVAPDGKSIAFVSQTGEGNSLHVVGVDGNGRSQLVTSSGLPVAEEAGDVGLFIGQIAWLLPDSRAIAFNTNLQNLVGPGVVSQQDLWIASVNGEVTERFAAGEGGQTFAISPNGQQVVFGRPEAVVRANMDGSQVETAVTFDFINTASEYAYAPMAQWLPDNSAAYVAIPSADPWQPEANASLFRIPRTGTAVPLGSILGNILFTPVNWTASGNNLVYVQMVPDGSGEQALTLAEGNGQNPQSYRVGNQLTLFAWSPNSAHFLYAGNGFFAVGRPGDAPLEVPIEAAATEMQWLNDNSFVLLSGEVGNWQLQAVNLAGETTVLATITADFVVSDVWVP